MLLIHNRRCVRVLLQAEQELNEFLLSVADDRKNVIATSVNAGYIDFAANWLCSISKMDIDNFFFIATDSESYEYMVSHGHRAYQVHTHEGNEGHKVRDGLFEIALCSWGVV